MPTLLPHHTCAALQQVGRIHCAAFSDDVLFAEMANKATFWQQRAYFGVDLRALFEPALDSYFAQASACCSCCCCWVASRARHACMHCGCTARCAGHR